MESEKKLQKCYSSKNDTACPQCIEVPDPTKLREWAEHCMKNDNWTDL